MMAALSGDWAAAVHYHVLSVPLLVGIVAYDLVALIDVLCGTNRLTKVDNRLFCRWMYPLYGALLLLTAVQKYA